MKKYLASVIIFFACLIVFSKLSFAGGGRILITTSDTMQGYYFVNRDVYVLAQVFKTGPTAADFSAGEHVEFRIQNPRPGDVCVTETAYTTDAGMTNARCSATTPGQMFVYVHSFDDNYDSSQYVLNFYPLPTPTVQPTQKILPTATTRVIPSLTPTVTAEPTIEQQNTEIATSAASETGLDDPFDNSQRTPAGILIILGGMAVVLVAGFGVSIFLTKKNAVKPQPLHAKPADFESESATSEQSTIEKNI